jgi:uncharacterized RDD family membrane protein YckC
MRRLRFTQAILLVALCAGGFGDGLAQAAQQPTSPPPAPDSARPVPAPDSARQPPEPVEAPDPFGDDDFFRRNRAVFRIGSDYALREGDAIREAVVIMGDVTIDGDVRQHLVVIMGSAQLGPKARVGDELVVIGGNVRVAEGAVVDRDLVIVGGSLDGPAAFLAGGEHVIIGPPFLGEWFEGLTEWLMRGLLFGRLIVPGLSWVWGAVALFFLIYLALNVIFERPVRTIATTLVEKPLTAFGVGLLVLLLFGPVATLLAITVIGIAVIPFLICALFGAWILGKVAVARWIGNGLMPEEAPENRAQAVRSFVIGFAVIVLAYMIPVIGIVTWAVIGVLGLGAASMAFVAAYKRERPAPPAAATPETPPPPPVPAPYQSPVSGAAAMSEASAVPFDSAQGPRSEAHVPPPPVQPASTLAGVGAAAMPASWPSTLLAMPRALFRDRFAAFVLDVIIVVIAVQILDVFFFFGYREDEAFPLFLLMYHVGFWTWKQTTVGGIICQLRLVRVDGNPLTFADALVRGLVGVFSLAAFFIGALWMLRDPESQTWHDKVAGTYVVKVPRNWPL